jgi:hypothetical protein
MAIRWITGFFDFPVAVFARGRDFWLGVTGYTLSPTRGPRGDFATLVPDAGDAYLRVQRIYSGPPGCHLDLQTSAWPGMAVSAIALGAQQLSAEDGLVVLRSPGGLPFCVTHQYDPPPGPAAPAHPVPAATPETKPPGRPNRPAAPQWPGGSVSRVDQFCLDIPSDRYDAECAFWADLTGWELEESPLPEFRRLTRPAGMPLRLLLQRTGDPAHTAVRAHPDLACSGEDAEAARHERLGATRLYNGKGWVTMRDPAGLTYCITRRDPQL